MSGALGGFPYRIGPHVFHRKNFHANFFLESRAESGELITYFQAVEHVFTYIESAPHVRDDGDIHNGRACAYQLANLGKNLTHFTIHLGCLDGLPDVRVQLLDGTTSLCHLCCRRFFLFLTTTVARHVILTLGSFYLGIGGLDGSLCLITALCRHYAFLVEIADAKEGLVGDVIGGLGLLKQFISGADGFLTGTIVGHLVEGCSSIAGTFGLCLLGIDLRSIQNGESVTGMHEVAFLNTQFKNTARQLARHTVFCHFYFSLNDILFIVEGEISDGGHDGHDCYKA